MQNQPMWSLSRCITGAGLLAVVATSGCVDQPPLAPGSGLVLTEIVATGAPHDWIEVMNVSGQRLDLIDYVYVDSRGDLDRARMFADITLSPGERHLQPVSASRSGFGLADDEEVWIYRAADGALVDGHDWYPGAMPAGGSLARLGDTGSFVAVAVATPGAANRGLPTTRAGAGVARFVRAGGD